MSKIKGITIEIAGETQKLQTALQEVNTKSRDLQSELKQVDRLLKLDPKNTELLTQKQKLLTEAVSTTKEKLDTLKEAERQVKEQFEKGKVGEEQYRAIQREVIQTEQNLRNLENQLRNTNNKWNEAADKVGAFGKKSEEIGKKLAPISAVAAGAGIAATKMGSDFADAIAKVSTIADTSSVPLETLREQILELSNQTGISAGEIANNVYDAISAGQDTADAVAFVANSTKLAKAGFAEAGQSLDVLTTIMNAYGIEADKVGEISDTLIQIQNEGKVTVGELSSVMGKIIPTANAVGVGLDQVGAGYAIMTSRGIKAAEATTYMNSMFNELAKTGSKADKQLREITNKSFKELIAEGNTVGDVLAILDENAKKNGLSLSDMFGSAEAAKAALTLLGDDASMFNDKLDIMNDSLGSTEEAFEKLQTPGEEARIAFNKIKNVMIELGDIILPVLGTMAEWISNVADKLFQMDESTKTVIVVIGALVAAIGPLLIFVGKVASAISAVMGLMGGLTGAAGATVGGMGALKAALAALLGPVGAVIAIVAALVAGILYLWKTNEEFRAKVQEIWDEVKIIIETTIELIKGIIDIFIQTATGLWEIFGDTITFITDTVWKLIAGIIEGVTKTIRGLLDIFVGLVTGDWGRFTEGLKGTWEGLWTAIKSVVKGAWDLIKGSFKLLKDAIAGWFIDIAKEAVQWGKNMIQGFIDGIKAMAGKVSDAVSGVMNNVKGFLGFNSPAKKGEGRFIEKWGYNMIDGFMDGIKNAIPELESTLKAVIPNMDPVMQTAGTLNNNYSSGDIIIQNMSVRNDQDIKLIARELNNLQKTTARGRGL